MSIRRKIAGGQSIYLRRKQAEADFLQELVGSIASKVEVSAQEVWKADRPHVTESRGYTVGVVDWDGEVPGETLQLLIVVKPQIMEFTLHGRIWNPVQERLVEVSEGPYVTPVNTNVDDAVHGFRKWGENKTPLLGELGVEIW